MIITNTTHYEKFLRLKAERARPGIENWELEEFTSLEGNKFWISYRLKHSTPEYVLYETGSGPIFFFPTSKLFEFQKTVENLKVFNFREYYKRKVVHALPKIAFCVQGAFLSYPKQEVKTQSLSLMLENPLFKDADSIPVRVITNLFENISPFFLMAENNGHSLNSMQMCEFRVAKEEVDGLTNFVASFTPVPVNMTKLEHSRTIDQPELLPPWSITGLSVDQVVYLRAVRSFWAKVSPQAEQTLLANLPNLRQILLSGNPNQIPFLEYMVQIHRALAEAPEDLTL
jgi:hypothetical protein